MQFRLRYRAHDLELPLGEFVIGRSEECQLALDDPLVSRRHGVLRVGARGVTVADLGSRNGVTVNGEKISGERRLRHGDRVTIGGQEMVLSEVTSEEGLPAGRALTQTLGDISIADVQRALAGSLSSSSSSSPPSYVMDEPTQTSALPPGTDQQAIREQVASFSTNPPRRDSQPKIVATFRLLSGMADKALAMGRAEEAERILSPVLHEVLEAQKKKAGDGAVTEQAVAYAIRLAGLTTHGSWIDYVFETHSAMGRLIAGPVVDDLHGVIRRAKVVNLRTIRDYITAMKAISATFSPNERFVLQRIEGLEQICALK